MCVLKGPHKLSIKHKQMSNNVSAQQTEKDNKTPKKHLIVITPSEKQLCFQSPPSVNDFQVSPLEEVAGTWWAGQH